MPLSDEQATRALQLLDELSIWNRSYNLTAITERGAMIRGHLLDSLAAHVDLAADHLQLHLDFPAGLIFEVGDLRLEHHDVERFKFLRARRPVVLLEAPGDGFL